MVKKIHKHRLSKIRSDKKLRHKNREFGYTTFPSGERKIVWRYSYKDYQRSVECDKQLKEMLGID